MSTVRDLIKGSLRLIGAIATGETPSADELNDGLSTLNDMIDSWSTESLFIPIRTRESFALVPGQSTYTMGPTGNFNTTRPIEILRAGLEDTTNGTPVERSVRLLNIDQWAQITIKSNQSTLPTSLYPEYPFPLATLTVWPVPSAARNLIVYSLKPLASYTSVNDALSLAPGYKRALRYNLAIEMAPEYGKQPNPVVIAAAVSGIENIKRRNIKPQYLNADPGVQSRRSNFNYRTGE